MSPPKVVEIVARIPDRVIEEIRERADVAQVVGRYVTLKRSGSRYWGLCPFHDEKTPSFSVNPEKQIFHCFGCGEGGDVFSFRMRQDGSDFAETVRALAQEFGVDIPARGDDGREARTSLLHGANEAALDYFRAGLRSPAGARARAYLEQRGVPQDLIERFALGFAPPGWDGLLAELKKRGISTAHAEEAGLVAPRRTGDGHYDRFRARLIFPITEANGRVIGFGGRALGDDTPKYLNSPESPIYRKGRALFGLSLATDAIRKEGRAIVVEGYFDLIALHRVGFANGVAPCGTALTEEHAKRLRRYTKEVVLLFDGDSAGRKAAERALPALAAAGLRVRGAFLPQGEDPDTLLERAGVEALRECIADAQPLIDTLIDERLGMRPLHEWEATDLAREFAPLVRAIPDAIERAGYERRIANRLRLDPATVARALADGAERPASRVAAAPAPARADVVAVVSIDPLVRTLLGCLVAHPELAALADGIDADTLPAGDGRELYVQVLRALDAHGPDGVLELLSPASDGLPERMRPALTQLLAEPDADDKATAERALVDCVARLRKEALESESRVLSRRLESCKDPEEQVRLLERKQQLMHERNALGA